VRRVIFLTLLKEYNDRKTMEGNVCMKKFIKKN